MVEVVVCLWQRPVVSLGPHDDLLESLFMKEEESPEDPKGSRG